MSETWAVVAPAPAMVTDELRRVVGDALALGAPTHQVVDEGWEAFADACGVANLEPVLSSQGNGTAVVVGADVATLVGQLSSATDQLVVLGPGLALQTMWQRGPRKQSFGPTLQLWRAGWSPVRVDRVRINVAERELEILVAIARRTPTPADPVTTT